MKPINIRLPGEMIAALRLQAESRGLDFSAHVRSQLAAALFAPRRYHEDCREGCSMTTRTSNAARHPHVEVRVLLPAEAAADIANMAKITGLATSQYIRTLVMTHVAKTYVNIEKNRD